MIANKINGARDMLREAAKQFRQLGDAGHAAMCEMHADELTSANNECGSGAMCCAQAAEIERLRYLIKAHVEASNNDDSAGDTFGALVAEVPPNAEITGG